MGTPIDMSRWDGNKALEKIGQIDLSGFDPNYAGDLKTRVAQEAALGSLGAPTTLTGHELDQAFRATGKALGNDGESYYSAHPNGMTLNPMTWGWGINQGLYDLSDKILGSGDLDKAMFSASDYLTPDDLAFALDLATDFIPYVGAGKGALQGLSMMWDGITGVDPNTGQKVSDGPNWADIGAGALMAGLSVVPGAKALTKGKKAVKGMKKIIGKITGEAADTAGTAAKSAVDDVLQVIDDIPTARALQQPGAAAWDATRSADVVDRFVNAINNPAIPQAYRPVLATADQASLKALTDAEQLRKALEEVRGISGLRSETQKLKALTELDNLPIDFGAHPIAKIKQGIDALKNGNINFKQIVSDTGKGIAEPVMSRLSPGKYGLTDDQQAIYEMQRLLGVGRQEARSAAKAGATTAQEVTRRAQSPEQLVDRIIKSASEGNGAKSDLLDLAELGPEAIYRMIPESFAPEILKELKDAGYGLGMKSKTAGQMWQETGKLREAGKQAKQAVKKKGGDVGKLSEDQQLAYYMDPGALGAARQRMAAIRQGLANASGNPFQTLKRAPITFGAGMLGSGLANLGNGNDFTDNWGQTIPEALLASIIGGRLRGRTAMRRPTRPKAGITDRSYSLPRVMASIINRTGDLYSIDPEDYMDYFELGDWLQDLVNSNQQEGE